MWPLIGMFQRGSKVLHRGKTKLGLFCKCPQYNFLNGRRQVGDLLMQWWRRYREMLGGDLKGSPTKRWYATQPLVDHRAQRVLVTGWLGLPLQLLGSQVERGSCDLLRQSLGAVGLRTGSQCRQTKVTEQNLIPGAKQHISRLDITVDEVLLMGVLQGRCDLLHRDGTSDMKP